MNPKPDADARLTRLTALYELGRWAEVSRQGAVLRAEGDVQAWLLHLASLSAREDWPAMRNAGRQALQRCGPQVSLHRMAFVACLQLGLTAQAQRHLDHAAALDPADPEVQADQAALMLMRGHPRAALDLLSTPLAEAPHRADWWRLQAMAQHAMGDDEAARASARQALRLDPAHPHSLGLVADLTLSRSRSDALALARGALRGAPTDSDHQQRVEQLGRGWWLDLSLAGLVVLATALQAWDRLGPMSFWAAALAVSCVGIRLQRQRRLDLLLLFSLGVCTASMAHAPATAPARAAAAGWQATGALDWVAFAAGSVGMAGLLAVLLVALRLLVWQQLLVLAHAGQAAWQAWRGGWLGEHLQEWASRRPLRLALAVAAGAALPSLPPTPLAWALLSHVLVLPLWAWACSRWLCPGEAQLRPALVFALLGFPAMLASTLAYGWAQAHPAHQALLALALGLAATWTTPPLLRLST